MVRGYSGILAVLAGVVFGTSVYAGGVPPLPPVRPSGYGTVDVVLRVKSVDMKAEKLPFKNIAVGDEITMKGFCNVVGKSKHNVLTSTTYWDSLGVTWLSDGKQALTIGTDFSNTIGITNNRAMKFSVFDDLRYQAAEVKGTHEYALTMSLFANESFLSASDVANNQIYDWFGVAAIRGEASLKASSRLMPGPNTPAKDLASDEVKFEVVSVNGHTVPTPSVGVIAIVGMGLIGLRRRR